MPIAIQPQRSGSYPRQAIMACLLFFGILFGGTAWAEGGCENDKGKHDAVCVEVTGGLPDPNSPEARWARGELTRPMSRARYWDFIGPQGTHILSGECWAVSPTVFVGRLNQLFFFASVSVGGTWDKPRVIVQSEAGLEKAPTKFHAYKQNLGLWAENLSFQTMDRQLGEHDILLGFSPERSKRIVESFANVLSFRLRLRYAPVDQSFDSPNVTLNGFYEAFKQVHACNRAFYK